MPYISNSIAELAANLISLSTSVLDGEIDKACANTDEDSEDRVVSDLVEERVQADLLAQYLLQESGSGNNVGLRACAEPDCTWISTAEEGSCARCGLSLTR